MFYHNLWLTWIVVMPILLVYEEAVLDNFRVLARPKQTRRMAMHHGIRLNQIFKSEGCVSIMVLLWARVGTH